MPTEPVQQLLLCWEMVSYIIPLLIISSSLYDGCAAKKNWEAEPISISTHSTNESLLNIQVRTERVGRLGYFLSGTMFWNIDVDESVMIHVQLYLSTTGAESDYKLTPMVIPRQTYINYLNTYYKDMVIKNLGDCSDMPQYEDKYVPPWPKKTYTVTRCSINGKGMPEILIPGFYKIHIVVSHPTVIQSIEVIIKITTKMF